MREIKFRAWDKKNKLMIMVDQILFSSNRLVFVWDNNMRIDNEAGLLIDKDIGILMQYTGLKDKNGKEIYEGDILKYEKYNDNMIIKPYTKLVEVSFKDGRFFGRCVKKAKWDKEDTFSVITNDCNRFEVIGNIHKNPELKKSGADEKKDSPKQPLKANNRNI